MPIIWRDKLSIGNDLIDQDHKYLICLFNCIEMAKKTPEDVKFLPDFFEQLSDYTKVHFAWEERVLLKMEYPGYMEHKIQHQQIIGHLEPTMEDLRKLINQNDTSPDNDKLKEQLENNIVSLAREWVIDHLIKTDKKMESYLRKFPKSFI